MRLNLNLVKSLLSTELTVNSLINADSLMITKILLQHLDSTSWELGAFNRLETTSLNMIRQVFVTNLILTAIWLVHTDETEGFKTSHYLDIYFERLTVLTVLGTCAYFCVELEITMIAELKEAFRAFDRVEQDTVTELAFLRFLDLDRRRHICAFKGLREDSESLFRQISDCHILIQ